MVQEGMIRVAGSGAPSRSIPRDLPQKPLGEVNWFEESTRAQLTG